MTPRRKKLFLKFLIGYFGCLSLPLLALAFSIAQGASWRPILAGLPVYLTIFVGITYQFAKELRSLSREERGEPPPPPKRSPWEDE